MLNHETSIKFRSFLSRQGISLRFSANTRPVDFTGQEEIDPIAAIYRAAGKPVLLRIPLNDCIFFSHLAFACTQDSQSPQIQTLIEYGRGNCLSWRQSSLVHFYNDFQPKNAAEMMGLESPSSKKLLELPPSAALLPWEYKSPERLIKESKENSLSESRQYGFPGGEGSSQFYGPNPDIKVELEFCRLVSVFNSLKSNGLVVDYEGFGNIQAVILSDGHSYKAFILSGHHRVAALSALGEESVILQIKQTGLSGYIDVRHSKFWPLVQSEFISKQEAGFLFERLYCAIQPSLYGHKLMS